MLLILAACGGGGGGGGGGDAVDRPQARASADTTEVNAAEGTVHLDGGESTSPNGDITIWQWRFLSRPEGSEATLDGADTAQASFTPDLPGTYVIQLVVNDGDADSRDSSSSRVTITALNPNPLAVVPDEINWILGIVQLDGSQSLPPDGGDANQLVYDWALTRKPEGSIADLDSGNLIYPRFTADEVGLYQAQLVVRHGDRVSQPATVDINIVEANAIPSARIEAPTEVVFGDTVTLDGSGSEDADGDDLQYRWRFLSNPPRGSSAHLEGATTSSARFVADSAYGNGRNTVELCVFDGISRNCTDTRVTVVPDEEAANTSPVAVIIPGNGDTFESERGAETSVSSTSYDVDGDALSHEWALISYPDGFDPEGENGLKPSSYCSATYCPATFTPTVDGDYTIELTVSDGEVSDTTTETFSARLGANFEPDARASTSGGTPTTLVGQPITLDGQASSDPDDNRLSYQWTILQRPDNSEAQLQQANTALPTLTPDQAGPYLISLVVTDEHGASSGYVPGNSLYEVLVLAKASNNPPVTRINKRLSGLVLGPTRFARPQRPYYDAEQPFAIRDRWLEGSGNSFRGDRFILEADSFDPDGDTLSHLWTQVSGPAGNRMQVNSPSGFESGNFNEYCVGGYWTPVSEESWQEFRDRVEAYTEWTCAAAILSPTEPGTYVFEYNVYDGSEFAGPFTTTVHAVEVEDYPTLLLEIPANAFNAEPSRFYSQAVFPLAIQNIFREWPWPEDDVLEIADFRLTAFDKDYVIEGVRTLSDNSNYVPSFIDVGTGQEITEGYVIPKGQTVEVHYQVKVSGETPPETLPELNEISDKLRNANIESEFSIQGKEGWTISIRNQ